MNAGIVAEFRMEGCSHGLALANDHRIIALGGQNLHAFANALDFWRADEYHLDRHIAKQALSNGAVNLTSVSVATDSDVECTQAELPGIFHFFGKQDCTGTGAKGRLQAHEIFQLLKTCVAKEPEERAGLTAWDDKAVDLIELLRLLDQHHSCTEFFQSLAVGVEIALERENADNGGSLWVLAISLQIVQIRLLVVGRGQERTCWFVAVRSSRWSFAQHDVSAAGC